MKHSEHAPTIIIVDDDEGHTLLISDSLREANLENEIISFCDGQSVLDFFFQRDGSRSLDPKRPYIVLLDIRMPKIDGIEVLRHLKETERLRKLPVIMLTTTDDPREVERCHQLGCSVYLQKPVKYEKFAEAIRRLGLFISLVLVPPISSQP